MESLSIQISSKVIQLKKRNAPGAAPPADEDEGAKGPMGAWEGGTERQRGSM